MSKEAPSKELTIKAPNIKTVVFEITGTAPYLQNRFSKKAREKMKATQEAGSKSKKGAKREPKDFEQCYKDSMHISEDGWNGIPAASFRQAMIAACRLAGFKMVVAKLAVFIESDGRDADEGMPLVKITKGAPEYHESYTRNSSGVCDLRARALWREWGASVRVNFDADVFTDEDVANLMMLAGTQVGIGEGRPSSPKSAGTGLGTFEITG
jgi:hypothetical protein